MALCRINLIRMHFYRGINIGTDEPRPNSARRKVASRSRRLPEYWGPVVLSLGARERRSNGVSKCRWRHSRTGDHLFSSKRRISETVLRRRGHRVSLIKLSRSLRWRELLLALQPLRNRVRAFHGQNKIPLFELRRGGRRFDLIRPICSEEYRFSG